MSNDFWARKLEKRARETGMPIVDAPPRRSDGPWWSQGSSLVPQQGSQAPEPQNPSQPREHDFSKAAHLKNEGKCPECGSGHYMKPSSASARRCFDCGSVENRSIHDISTMMSPTIEGPAQRARQTDSGGRVINNYHSIQSASQAIGRIS